MVEKQQTRNFIRASSLYRDIHCGQILGGSTCGGSFHSIVLNITVWLKPQSAIAEHNILKRYRYLFLSMFLVPLLKLGKPMDILAFFLGNHKLKC